MNNCTPFAYFLDLKNINRAVVASLLINTNVIYIKFCVECGYKVELKYAAI